MTIFLIFRDFPDAVHRKKIKKILKEGRKARQNSVEAEAGARDGDNANDNADSICWFCHTGVTKLENNKCAGCRKVAHLPSPVQIMRVLIPCFRRATVTVTVTVRRQNGDGMTIIVSWCKRRSGIR